MKKYIITVLAICLLLLSCKIFRPNSKLKSFNGNITFSVVTTIENEKRFNKELSNYVNTSDSLYKLENPNDTTWTNINGPTVRLMLDPREDPRRSNSYYKPSIFSYEYLDTLISYKYEYGNSKYKVEINTVTSDYTKYDLTTNRIVKTKKYKFFTNEKPFEKFVYKDSVKIINGFNCYKVLVIEDYIEDKLEGLKTYKEMYLTEDIHSLYHPMQIRKELLENHYPLEIKLYSDFLKDKVTYYKAKSIDVY